MGRDEGAVWEVDPDDAQRLAELEAELARIYDRLQAGAPDSETALVLERLASSARSRADVFREACAPADLALPDDEGLVARWLEAQSRFESAAAEAAGDGDPDLDEFRREVARMGRDVDVLLIVAGRALEDG